MRKSSISIFLVLASLFIFSSTAQARVVEGSNTKLEANKWSGGVWHLWLCTRLVIKNPPKEKKVKLIASTAVENKVLRMRKYEDSKIWDSKTWWPGKKMRCYHWTIKTKPLNKVKSSWVRKLFKTKGEVSIRVRIGNLSGVIDLNAQ